MKTYNLYISKIVLIIVFAFFLIGAVVGFGSLIDQIFDLGLFDQPAPPMIFLILWLCVVGYIGFGYLQIPYRIRILENETVQFQSLLRTILISSHEIQSIKANLGSLGFVHLRYTKGTLHLINQMNGFHEFLSWLKSVNPQVVIKGL